MDNYNVKDNFEAGFEEQIEDMLILTGNKPTNGYSSKGYREVRCEYIAVWNMQTDKPEHSFGKLMWIERDSGHAQISFQENAGLPCQSKKK